jgi:RNA polymerase primary sigma factor
MANIDHNVMFYLTQIGKIPLLTRAQEYKYAKLAQKGDNKAKQMLISSNLKFVVQTAKRYSSCGLSILDLISEGNLGLIRAVDSFDPDKGFHFISYAVHWIKQSIIKAISEKSKIVRIPLNLNNSLTQIERSLRENHQSEVSDKVIGLVSDEVRLSKKDTINLLQITQKPASLDQNINNDGENKSQLKDLIEDTNNSTPESTAINNSLTETVLKLLKRLTPVESEVIAMRFGLDGRTPKTLLEIGNIKNLTKERIRQIEKGALLELKKDENKMLVKEYS